MPLFQSTVITKYLNTQQTATLQTQWQRFQNHFHDSAIQENIRNSKEEQYQGEFLIDLFVNVLGYTKNPTPNFNLTTEYKNVKDSKKADGAIILNDEVKAVIELKGTETTDLGKVEAQAFGYKNNQPKCKYVITSNFEKLRFYIDNATEHLEFNLFTLDEKDFQLLYLCLAKENLEKDIPQEIKNESLSKEGEITKQLYKDYSLFKRELHNNLVALNPQFDALTLFKKSQKLLDRFLFLLFAEDRALLPPNSVRLVLSDWKELIERDEQVHLFDRFKKYFGYLNNGFKGKRYDVYPYNGGLFKPDEILDTIAIDDSLLYDHTLKLSEYNFASEVDVNILGHIFENSLTEIEEVEAELTGKQTEKTKSKRKKDGVFYTPKYITKYIVENTVGKLCEQKKTELDITDENYQPAKQRSRKRIENLQAYRDWLLKITICDPACGSGAFLNQALEFLIAEHGYIDELSAKYNNDAFVLSEVENSILEHNLFGVDINEESVAIAKLSLWLRTAQKNRKLNDLSHNIKCGNSLIDDEAVAGAKAFKWEEEFKTVFADGGFDVVIGNPPYVDSEIMTQYFQKERTFIRDNYETAVGNWDLYIPFFERGLKLLKENGKLSLIVPNKVLSAKYGEEMRMFVMKSYSLDEIFNVSYDDVFDVDVYPVSIFISNRKQINSIKISQKKKDELVSFQVDFEMNINWALFLEQYYNFYKSILKNKMLFFENQDINLYNAASVSEAYEIVEKIEDLINFDETRFFKLINTGTIDPYINFWGVREMSYIKKKYLYPIIEKSELKNKEWTLKPKIIIAGMALKIEAFLDSNASYLPLKSTIVITANSLIDLYTYCAILNSKLASFLFQIANSANTMAGGYINIHKDSLSKLPLPVIDINAKQDLSKLTSKMLELRVAFQESKQKLIRNIQRNFELETLSKKLENWHGLSFAAFVNELKKKKVVLSLSQQAEWEDYFLKEQQKAQTIKTEIDKLDSEIDALVYGLYGLTEAEIKIVEGD